MPSNSDISGIRSRTAPPTMTVRSWPLRDEPLRAGGLVLLQVFVGMLAIQATRPATGVLVLCFFLMASWQLWLPTTLELSSKGIVRTVFFRRRRIPWHEFSHYEAKGKGVLLHRFHPDSTPKYLATGLFLPGKPSQSELAAALDYYLVAKPSEPLPSTQTIVP